MTVMGGGVGAEVFVEDRSELWKLGVQTLIYCVVTALILPLVWLMGKPLHRADFIGIGSFIAVIACDGLWNYLSWVLSRKVSYVVSAGGVAAFRGRHEVVQVTAERVDSWELEPAVQMWSELLTPRSNPRIRKAWYFLAASPPRLIVRTHDGSGKSHRVKFPGLLLMAPHGQDGLRAALNRLLGPSQSEKDAAAAAAGLAVRASYSLLKKVLLVVAITFAVGALVLWVLTPVLPATVWGIPLLISSPHHHGPERIGVATLAASALFTSWLFTRAK